MGFNIVSYRKTVLIHNPYAGRARRLERQLERAVEILRRDGHNLTIIPTQGPGSATGIARKQIAEGCDLMLVTGGDGTINEVAEGMVHSEVPLGILPGGTANVLASEMKLGSRLSRAAERLPECHPHRISVGHVTCGAVSRHFLLMAGIGLDAHIVYHVSGSLKARTGKFAYWIAGWSLLGRRLPEFQVEAGGRKSRCSFALISKVRNYGGDLEIARQVSLFDDHFEVILFEGRNTLPYVKYLWGVMTRRLDGMKGVTILEADCVRASVPEDQRIYVQVDGEFVGRLPAQIRIVPDALTVLVPPEYEQARRQQETMMDSGVERS